MSETDRLILAADIDELVVHVDRLVAAGDWDEVARTRVACRAALDSGRQLWPVASWAAYRVALDGPNQLAAESLYWAEERFGPGPLSEVAATNHTYSALAEYLVGGPEASVFAHERALRGEPVAELPGPDVFGVPLETAPWEPAWPTPAYTAEGLVDDQIIPATGPSSPLNERPDRPRFDDEVTAALGDVVDHWVENGRGSVVVAGVEGPAHAAIGAVCGGSVMSEPISADRALIELFSAASGGGASGRRRGSARGRAAVWWVVRALWDDSGKGPLDELFWYAFSTGWRGWWLGLAVEDAVDDLAWAVAAVDRI